MILQFHSDKNKNDINNSTCFIINEGNSIKNKVVLKCSFNEYYYFNIINGYSELSNGNLFVLLKNIENKEEMDEIEPFNLRYHSQNSSGISTGAIIGRIIGGLFLFVLSGLLLFVIVKKEENVNLVQIWI